MAAGHPSGTGPAASLDDYVVDVPLNGPPLHPGGSLTLMPAGRAPSPNYFQDLRHLRLEQGLDEGWVLDALVDLRDQLATDLDADLLLVDARTGITATNRVTTHVLADEVVALALDTPEQLEGTRSVLRRLRPLTSLRTDVPIDLHLVLSRVLPRPRAEGIYALTASETEQVTRVRAFLAEPAQPITSTVEIDRVHLLHTDPALNREEFLALERPGPWTRIGAPRGLLADRHRGAGHRRRGRRSQGPGGSPRATRSAWRSWRTTSSPPTSSPRPAEPRPAS